MNGILYIVWGRLAILEFVAC